MVLTSGDQLFQKLRVGDENAMHEIFTLYYPSVFFTIKRMLNNQSASEDIAQEVFIDLWNKREQISIVSNFESYLRRMAVNKTLNYIRSQKNNVFHEDLDNIQDLSFIDLEGSDGYKELEELIHQTIDKLPVQCKLIFVLSRFEDYSNKMIAEQLGISVKTVENQMTKAIKFIRTVIEIYKR